MIHCFSRKEIRDPTTVHNRQMPRKLKGRGTHIDQLVTRLSKTVTSSKKKSSSFFVALSRGWRNPRKAFPRAVPCRRASNVGSTTWKLPTNAMLKQKHGEGLHKKFLSSTTPTTVTTTSYRNLLRCTCTSKKPKLGRLSNHLKEIGPNPITFALAHTNSIIQQAIRTVMNPSLCQMMTTSTRVLLRGMKSRTFPPRA